MATSNIVTMLLEGGGTFGNLALDMPQYTLESGAALIARESAQELHDIFEVAIVETNEAALGAYMEGNEDVMESATYGPVFEAAEKSAGQKILDFLRKIKDRVVAFFKSIGAKIMLLVGNYEKFYNKKKDELNKAKALKDCPCIDWQDERLDKLESFIKAQADSIKSETPKFINRIKSVMEDEGAARTFNAKKLANDCDEWITARCKSIGIAKNASTEMDMTQINKDIQLIFRKPEKVKRTIDGGYVKDILVKTKSAAKGTQTAQKAFDSAYNDAIKSIKSITDEMTKKQKSGYTQYIHKVVSTLSKAQNLINTYASVGYRCLIGRANEAKTLTNAIISGNVPKGTTADDKWDAEKKAKK